MIFTERQITVRKGKSSIDDSIVLYRGDFEVELRFTIMETKYRFKSGVNLVDSEKASHAQLALLAPDGTNVFTEIGRCEDGTAIFVLSKEMIDELSEVGLYSFQIRLFDYYRESRITIPPVEFGIEVREPIAAEDHTNAVDDAMVGYSIAKTSVLDEPVPDTFNVDGQYNKTDWETGDRISEGKLNKLEDAAYQINKNEKDLDRKVDSNYNVLNSIKADRNDLNIVSSRMDSFISLKDGSTTGDAELIDGRIGNNGVTYENIGTAIRKQFQLLEGQREFLETLGCKTKLIDNSDFEYGVRLTAEGHIIRDQFGTLKSNKHGIPIQDVRVEVTNCDPTDLICSTGIYTSDGKFIGMIEPNMAMNNGVHIVTKERILYEHPGAEGSYIYINIGRYNRTTGQYTKIDGVTNINVYKSTIHYDDSREIIDAMKCQALKFITDEFVYGSYILDSGFNTAQPHNFIKTCHTLIDAQGILSIKLNNYDDYGDYFYCYSRYDINGNFIDLQGKIEDRSYYFTSDTAYIDLSVSTNSAVKYIRVNVCYQKNGTYIKIPEDVEICLYNNTGYLTMEDMYQKTEDINDKVKELEALTEIINDSIDSIIDDSPTLIMDDFVYGAYVNTGGYVITGGFGGMKVHHDFISIQEGMYIELTNCTDYENYFYCCALYDKNGNFINLFGSDTVAEVRFSANKKYIDIDAIKQYPNVEYMRVNIARHNKAYYTIPEDVGISIFSGPDGLSLTELNAKIAELEARVQVLEDRPDIPDIPTPSNNIRFTNISVIGDSITYGATLSNPTQERYSKLLADSLGVKVNNYGVSGSKISNVAGDGTLSFVERLDQIDRTSDLIILFGGTNDYWHDATPIGELDSDDTSTFCGALNHAIDYLQTNFIGKDYLFIFPFNQFFNGVTCENVNNAGSMDDFRKAFIDVCSRKGVPVLDLYSNSGMDIAHNMNVRNYYTADGVHPNVEGHKRLAKLIESKIRQL